MCIITDEESGITLLTGLTIILDEKIAAYACDKRHESLLDEGLDVATEHERA